MSTVFSAGALIFGCTVALCFLIRDLMFYVIGEFVADIWLNDGLTLNVSLLTSSESIMYTFLWHMCDTHYFFSRWNYCFHHCFCLYYQVPVWACSESGQLSPEWGPRAARWPQHLWLCSGKLPGSTFLQGVMGLEGTTGSGPNNELQGPGRRGKMNAP